MKKQALQQIIWLLCLAVLPAGCQKKPEPVKVIRAIKTMTVKPQTTEQILKFPGIVAAVDSSDLSFQVGGQVKTVGVDIGDTVDEGQVIAVLDPESFQLEVHAIQAELIKAKDNVNKTKAQYERQKRIYEQGAGAKSWLEVAEYNYKASKSAVDFQVAKLDLANRDLRLTKLVAPYHGTIVWRSVDPHEEVRAGQKMFEINATGKMEVQLAMPETSIDRIHVDDPATITFPTQPGAVAQGRISYIGSAAVKANAFPVKVELLDPNKKVKPGMTAEANLIVKDENRKPGYLVPLQALLPAPDKNRGYAFVFDSKTSLVKKTAVHFHSTKQKQVVVDEGLAEGDIVAVAGVSFLADGMKVKRMKQ